MEAKYYEQLTLAEASKSKAKKRKVGAIIVDDRGIIFGQGYNYNAINPDASCEDVKGDTFPSVVHAEIAAIERANDNIVASPVGSFIKPYTIYITHQPCDNCRKAIADFDIENIVIVNEFMKFDTSKLRYDLIPPSSTRALASVLTYGAKKYKPGNWKMVDAPDRYIAATMRHFEAYRNGEINDLESNMPHLWHVMTNIAFLIDLDYKPGAY